MLFDMTLFTLKLTKDGQQVVVFVINSKTCFSLELE